MLKIYELLKSIGNDAYASFRIDGLSLILRVRWPDNFGYERIIPLAHLENTPDIESILAEEIKFSYEKTHK